MWIAMFAQRHKHVYGTTDEDFGQIAITFRRHATANPPLERCHRCAAPTSFAAVAGTGSIYSYIVVHHPSVPAFAHPVPCIIALAIGQRVRADLTQFPGAAERAITFRRIDLPATDSPAVRR
jgi:hypothetical protein